MILDREKYQGFSIFALGFIFESTVLTEFNPILVDSFAYFYSLLV